MSRGLFIRQRHVREAEKLFTWSDGAVDAPYYYYLLGVRILKLLGERVSIFDESAHPLEVIYSGDAYHRVYKDSAISLQSTNEDAWVKIFLCDPDSTQVLDIYYYDFRDRKIPYIYRPGSWEKYLLENLAAKARAEEVHREEKAEQEKRLKSLALEEARRRAQADFDYRHSPVD